MKKLDHKGIKVHTGTKMLRFLIQTKKFRKINEDFVISTKIDFFSIQIFLENINFWFDISKFSFIIPKINDSYHKSKHFITLCVTS